MQTTSLPTNVSSLPRIQTCIFPLQVNALQLITLLTVRLLLLTMDKLCAGTTLTLNSTVHGFLEIKLSKGCSRLYWDLELSKLWIDSADLLQSTVQLLISSLKMSCMPSTISYGYLCIHDKWLLMLPTILLVFDRLWLIASGWVKMMHSKPSQEQFFCSPRFWSNK